MSRSHVEAKCTEARLTWDRRQDRFSGLIRYGFRFDLEINGSSLVELGRFDVFLDDALKFGSGCDGTPVWL